MSSTNSDRLFALVDCNNFFASCETLFRPDLVGRPVVVLSSNDGCIVARSREARALGIPMGAPEFSVREALQRHNVTVFSSNFALYSDMSSRVMATLEHLCADSADASAAEASAEGGSMPYGSVVEQYSVDEAFIRLEGALRAQAPQVAAEIRDTVRRWTGITVSVGIAATRTLAKIANLLAKRDQGVCLLHTNTPEMEAALASLPVGEVWGIGRRQTRKLHEVGITSALHLREVNDAWARKNLTVSGWKTALELRGLACFGEGEGPVPRRTLVVSRSFGQRVFDVESLEQAVATFTVRGAERLRREGLTAAGVGVHIRTARHGTGGQYDVTGHTALPLCTADSPTLMAAARRVLHSLYVAGPAYAKAGITLTDLAPRDAVQGSLLAQPDPVEEAHSAALMQTVDRIRRRFGRQALAFGAEGPREARWHVRHDRRSPERTTRWEELPRIACGVKVG